MEDRRQLMKKKILKGAAKVFSKYGLSGATISLIAQEAQVSETSIYEYFKGKEDLLLAIPTATIEEGLPMIEDHLFGIKDALTQLRKFVWLYVRDIVNDPITGRIIMLHLRTNAEFHNSDAYKEVKRFFNRLLDIIVMGQKTGEIRNDITAYSARILVMGTVEHLIIRWLLKNCSYDIFDHLEQAYKLIEDALRSKEKV